MAWSTSGSSAPIAGATGSALRLARFFGTTPEFWLNLQQSHDLKLALKASKGRIAKTVRPRAGAGEPVAPS